MCDGKLPRKRRTSPSLPAGPNSSMADDKRVVVFEKKVHPVISEVDALKIKDPETMKKGVEFLSLMNKHLDGVDEEEKKITDPAKLIIKNEQARWKPIRELLKPRIESLRKMIGAYQTKEDEKADKKREKIGEKVVEGKMSLEKGIEKAGAIAGPEKTVSTEAGLVQFREDKKFEVMDITLLPMEYHLPDEVAIRKAMKDGKELPGVRYWKEKTPINKR